MDELKINPEKMVQFFNNRADTYDEHMKQNVNSFDSFYQNIAKVINNTQKQIKILDIGCGTGLELEYIFYRAPNASITGIDISRKMLDKLLEKFKDNLSQITLINESYLESPFMENYFDYIISVMSLHHLTYDLKKNLYIKIYNALKKGGKYIEGDYIVSKEREISFLKDYREKFNGDIKRNSYTPGSYHIDIPFSIETQKKLLMEAGYRTFTLCFLEHEACVYTAEK